jgi:hypothetical protein
MFVESAITAAKRKSPLTQVSEEAVLIISQTKKV